MTKTTAEGNGGGTLSRAILLLAVAAILATLVAATAAPAFAGPKPETCEKIAMKHDRVPRSCR